MVALYPTEVDMKSIAIAVSATLVLLTAPGASWAQASGAMANDSMKHDSMSKDQATDKKMDKDKMGHDDMKKGDAMGMKHEASGAMAN
jgi:pentapeptide MXKDX repeat protein